MRIKIWGARGSTAAPMSNMEYRSNIKNILRQAVASELSKEADIDAFISALPEYLTTVFGGNTTCVSVESNAGEFFILDCGTGLRDLGNELMLREFAKGKGKANIMLSHNHLDHIQGLPFFKPVYIKGNVFTFCTPFQEQRQILSGMMTAPYFPVSWDSTASSKQYHLIDPNISMGFKGGLKVDVHRVMHPNGCYAYRFRENGKTFIFATDAEFNQNNIDQISADGDFFYNADLLILDAQYDIEESAAKIDWGHTSYTMAVNCAVKWKAKTLVMTHHEPSYSNEKLAFNNIDAAAYAREIGAEDLNILSAIEGMEFNL